MLTRFPVFALAMIVAATIASPAAAQIPTVELENGAVAPPKAPPPPTPVTTKQPIIVNVPGAQGQSPQAEAEENSGFYYRDDLDLEKPQQGIGGTGGPVPETHVVRSGDTLWDICGFYFSNPWEWPRIWSYNPTITNPHWIYPGDLVRLYVSGVGPIAAAPTSDGAEKVGVTADAPSPRRGFTLRHIAFVDADKLKDAMVIDGSVDEKLMLSRGESVYLKYGKKRPKSGEKYSVYDEVEKVVHPKTGKVVGAFVRIRGDVKVQSVKKERRARALITRSTKPIERGQQVGPIKKVFDEVKPRRNEKSMQGFIVGKITRGELIGSRDVILIDVGSKAGVQVGNRLFVVRRGDAYPERTEPRHQIGIDDRRYPARAIGEVIIVDVGKQISMALVTVSSQEFGIGDMVLMRRDRE